MKTGFEDFLKILFSMSKVYYHSLFFYIPSITIHGFSPGKKKKAFDQLKIKSYKIL